MAIKDELIEELMKGYEKPEGLIGENGLLKDLTKRLLEKAMQGELTHHLGYPKWSPAGKNTGNSRNGKNKKTIKGEFGEMEIEVPKGPQRRLRADDHSQGSDPFRWVR